MPVSNLIPSLLTPYSAPRTHAIYGLQQYGQLKQQRRQQAAANEMAKRRLAWEQQKYMQDLYTHLHDRTQDQVLSNLEEFRKARKEYDEAERIGDRIGATQALQRMKEYGLRIEGTPEEYQQQPAEEDQQQPAEPPNEPQSVPQTGKPISADEYRDIGLNQAAAATEAAERAEAQFQDEPPPPGVDPGVWEAGRPGREEKWRAQQNAEPVQTGRPAMAPQTSPEEPPEAPQEKPEKAEPDAYQPPTDEEISAAWKADAIAHGTVATTPDGQRIVLPGPRAQMKARAMIAERAWAQMLPPLKTEEENRAAEIAGQAVQATVRAGRSDEEASKAGLDMFKYILGQFNAQKRAETVAYSKGIGQGAKIVDDIGKQIDSFVRNAMQQEDYTGAKERLAAGQQMMKLAASDDPMQQQTALLELLKTYQGSRPTDKDLAFTQGMAGEMERLAMGINRWLRGGALPANYKEQLQRMGQLMVATALDQRLQAGLKVKQEIINNPSWALNAPNQEFLQRFADWGFGRFTGEFEQLPENFRQSLPLPPSFFKAYESGRRSVSTTGTSSGPAVQAPSAEEAAELFGD